MSSYGYGSPVDPSAKLKIQLSGLPHEAARAQTGSAIFNACGVLEYIYVDDSGCRSMVKTRHLHFASTLKEA